MQLTSCQRFRRADREDMGCFFLINVGIAGETAKAGRVLSDIQWCQCLKGANGMTLQKTVKAYDFFDRMMKDAG